MVKKFPELALLISELSDEVTDFAEGQLMLAVKRGDPWAVKYWLDNRGQDRGYGVRKLAFRDEQGELTIPAQLVAGPTMSHDEWEAKFGTAGLIEHAPQNAIN